MKLKKIDCAPLFLICVLCASAALGQSQASMPFLPAQFSVFNVKAPSSPMRQIKFVLPDKYLSSPTTPSTSINADGLDSSNPTVTQHAVPYAITTGVWYSGLAIPPYLVSCNPGEADGSAEIELLVNAEMLIMQEDDIEDELLTRIVPLFHTDVVPASSYTYQAITLNYTIQGGEFDGEMVPLHGEMASGSAKNTNGNPSSGEEWTGEMFLALNWGVDPLGNTNYILLDFQFTAEASTSSSTCLSLQDAIQNTLGTSTVAAYFTPEWNALTAQASSSSMTLQGAIPELLYVYDFSQTSTYPPAVTLPAGYLATATVLDATNQTAPGYTNVYKIVNQYDAGLAFNLPVRFGMAGGNACGPTALGMALYVQHVSSVNARSVYDNTTDGGLNAGTNANAFSAWRAILWLQNKPDWRPQGFSAPSPLPSGTIVAFRYAQGPSYNSPNILATWADIDRLLGADIPVEIRTDLGAGTGPGSGHMILLLGIGNSPDLAQMYQTAGFTDVTSGDYYIVADPAGCFFANFDGAHYAPCLTLAKLNAGMNYGGWFAMYPKEILRQRFTQSRFPNYAMCGLVLGLPFHGLSTTNFSTNSEVTVVAHSPVVYTITDPIGRQSGWMADGSVVQNIPVSYFLPAFAEEEEQGTNYIDPLGPKGFELVGPLDGVYHLQMTGTNSGSYEMDWNPINGVGTVLNATTYSGTTSAGNQTNYMNLLQAGGIPCLQSLAASNGIGLVWPTNAVGFSLQSNTNLNHQANWTNVPGPFWQTNGVFALTNAFSGAAQFYRLKN